uniref:RHS repeat-associated core domain-containing protein n=1 Tax=Shewanella algicola TaxID=640633 RepID=UPI0024951AD1
GSVIATTNGSGAVVSQAIYDPWGKRTAVYLDSSLASFTTSEPTDRGYTGHKHIKDLDIIHMGGRIYDSTLGRFLQADPLVQAPTDSQSYNRYAYVRNNPMSMTDPTGYSWLSKAWDKIKPYVGAIAGIVVAMYCPACGATMWNAAMTGAAIGAGSAAINGGDIWKGAFTGALAGAAFQQIGANFNGKEGSGFFAEGGLGHIATHGATGGVMSVLQGGKFGHGFLAAGLTKALNINKMIGTAAKDAGLRVTIAAVVGGTISRITGGKFANGAITAAFAQAFNGNKQAEREQAWTDFRSKYGAIVDAGGIDITKNIAEASNMDIESFVDAVKTGGKWDYKNPAKYGHLVQQFGSSLMDDFGNVHFGMVAAASTHTVLVKPNWTLLIENFQTLQVTDHH